MVVNSKHILTLQFKKNAVINWKESNKSWTMVYFNNTTILNKTMQTSESKTKTTDHFNKSALSKEEAYIEMLNFRNQLISLYSCNELIDIKLEDYINLSNTNKRMLNMVNNLNCINWQSKEVPIDPYIFGLWLGDGDHNGHGFTSIDEEIVKSFAIWADTINAEITHHPNVDRDDCYHYGIRRKTQVK